MTTTCIRRPGSEWTLCRCETCRPYINRKRKLLDAGLTVVNDQRDQAWARVVAWVEAGYSMGVIARLAGVGTNAAYRMVRDARNGRRRRIQHDTAKKILAAPAHPHEGGGFVPSIGTSRRLRALTVMGWSMTNLADRCDIPATTLHALRDPRHKVTRPRYADTVRNLYDQLSMTHGPCQYAATRARRLGWVPPLAWDDDTIDDPDATPHTGRVRRPGGGRPAADTAEDVEFLLRHDPTLTADQVGARLGVGRDAIQNALAPKRGNRPDLIDQLNRNADLLRPGQANHRKDAA